MNENREQTSGATYTCDFGTVGLDIPFSQQPSLKQFLDVPTSEERRLISDELLRRFLLIARCAINQELVTSQQSLIDLHVGYELWKALPPGIEDYTIRPGDLIEHRWLNRDGIHEGSPPHEHPTSTLPNQVVEQLMQRCQENARQRISSNLLVGKSLYIFIHGITRRVDSEHEMVLIQRIFGIRGCICDSNGTLVRAKGQTCQQSCDDQG